MEPSDETCVFGILGIITGFAVFPRTGPPCTLIPICISTGGIARKSGVPFTTRVIWLMLW